jgi:hypothetical protein
MYTIFNGTSHYPTPPPTRLGVSGFALSDIVSALGNFCPPLHNFSCALPGVTHLQGNERERERRCGEWKWRFERRENIRRYSMTNLTNTG